MAVRFCNHCKKPFQEGHVLYDEYYYCNETCLRLDNSSDEEIVGKTIEEMYENDVQYWTEWNKIEPYYAVVPVFEVFDTFFYMREDAQNVAKEHQASKEQVKHKYVLLSQEEYDTPDSRQGYSSTEYKIYNTLQDVRNAYEELEEEAA